MPNTWKPLDQLVNEIARKTAVRWDPAKSKWRVVPCPEDEMGQFEAVARREDARKGFGDE